MESRLRWFLWGSLLLAVGKPVSDAATDIDGGWSPWSATGTPCSKSCGGGLHQKYRSCSSPTPQGNGLDCPDTAGFRSKTEVATFPCNTQSCWNNTWTAWSLCLPNCTEKGTNYREATCDGVVCNGTDQRREEKSCNSWNKTTCPSPCEDAPKIDYANCEDISDDVAPKYRMICIMGYQMNDDKTACLRPPPPVPTIKPIPTLPAAQKMVATVISKSASSVLIFFVGVTLVLFLVLRIFTSDRVIQMNMEIALISAHIFLMFPADVATQDIICKVISILIHFFFTACYAFVMLEALHMYSLVAHVVRSEGMLTKLQNTLVGWGLAGLVVLLCILTHFEDYGGQYHCWAQMDKPLIYGHIIPALFFGVVTFSLIEAAGSAEYDPLKGNDKKQLLSAKISQRSNLIILPLIFAHWIIGMLSEYEQNMALYGIFSILNGITGFVVFFFHSTGNQHVRTKLKALYKAVCK